MRVGDTVAVGRTRESDAYASTDGSSPALLVGRIIRTRTQWNVLVSTIKLYLVASLWIRRTWNN